MTILNSSGDCGNCETVAIPKDRIMYLSKSDKKGNVYLEFPIQYTLVEGFIEEEVIKEMQDSYPLFSISNKSKIYK